MEEIKGLNQEIQQLVEQIRIKRQEAIKAKLSYLQENSDNKEAHLTEEEWVLLKEYLIEIKDPTSTKMQHGWYEDIDGFDTNDYETILRIGNKYIAIHDGMTNGHEWYSFDVSDSLSIETDTDGNVRINGIDFVKDRDEGWNGVSGIISGRNELTRGLDIETLFEREKEIDSSEPSIEDDREEDYEYEDEEYDDYEYDDDDYYGRNTEPDDYDVIYNILRNRIPDYNANAMFGENNNFCEIGQYSDMPGEEEIAIILNSMDRETLRKYFEQNPEDIALFETMRTKYEDILALDDEIKTDVDKRQKFENSLLRDDIVEYYSDMTPEELEEEFGSEVVRMVGFEQKNAHHCYDLWQHTLHTVESVDTTGLTEEQTKKLKVAAFFHDIGKPDVVGFNERTQQQNFFNHAVHSVDIASPILERLGYSPEEIQQIGFFIGHHDDFINYKSTIPDAQKSHAFFREVSDSTVSEIVIQNQFDWDKLGLPCYLPTHTGNQQIDEKNKKVNDDNKLKQRYICSMLANGVAPKFRGFKNAPIKVDVDIDEVVARMASGECNAQYVPTEEDYKLLLELCKADARAQSEQVISKDAKTGKETVIDSRERKVATMEDIGGVIELAYREGIDKIPQNIRKDIEELTGYSFEQFIKDSIPQALGEKRPVVVCKDGTEYSIQASSFHDCSPRVDGLDSYDSFEIYALTNWEGLEEFMNYDDVAGSVPLAVVEQILKTHGGLDSEKMIARVKEQKAVYQPKDEAYEKMIQEASGGNEFLAKMLRYATRKCEVRDKNDKAKQLYEDYETQLPKDQISLDDND